MKNPAFFAVLHSSLARTITTGSADDRFPMLATMEDILGDIFDSASYFGNDS